jgi:uncharacterized protein (DUF433 family)
MMSITYTLNPLLSNVNSKMKRMPAALGWCVEAIMLEKKELIVSDPEVMMGKPVIAGTRITVELILEKLAAGETAEEIIDAHPRLNEGAIRAALHFAAQALRADVTYPVESSVR